MEASVNDDSPDLPEQWSPIQRLVNKFDCLAQSFGATPKYPKGFIYDQFGQHSPALSSEEDPSPLEATIQSLQSIKPALHDLEPHTSYNSTASLIWDYWEALFEALYDIAATGWLAQSLDNTSTPVAMSHVLVTLQSVESHLDPSVQYLGTDELLHYPEENRFSNLPLIGMTLQPARYPCMEAMLRYNPPWAASPPPPPSVVP